MQNAAVLHASSHMTLALKAMKQYKHILIHKLFYSLEVK